MDSDYVVVGTGSAGSVVANRLSADPHVSVTVLEAGPWDKNRFIHIPATFALKLFRSEVDWDYLTEPQKWLNNREIYCARGKVLGGSSSTNAMMWVRGFAADYDEWGALAGEDWDFAHVAGYFERIENGPLVLSAQRSPRTRRTGFAEAAVRERWKNCFNSRPTIRRTIASWLIWCSSSSPALRPSRNTVTRSAMISTSLRRCEM